MRISEATILRIYELCNERNLTINALSTLCGITQSTLSNIVRGRNYSTKITTIKKICDGLDITIQDFFNSNVFDDLEQEIK